MTPLGFSTCREPTNLTGIDLTDAALRDANLTGAYLEDADLADAQVSVEQLLTAYVTHLLFFQRGSPTTQLSKNTSPLTDKDSSGQCCRHMTSRVLDTGATFPRYLRWSADVHGHRRRRRVRGWWCRCRVSSRCPPWSAGVVTFRPPPPPFVSTAGTPRAWNAVRGL
ncbi:pentapeptide repeat-containing protein [Streptomyces xiamenensis]|uniref:pentapeptide repeat-containing protein n=1 Tax=Streptomyces xiamenensis TaxID=408015 RepID=UPI0037D4FE57